MDYLKLDENRYKNGLADENLRHYILRMAAIFQNAVECYQTHIEIFNKSSPVPLPIFTDYPSVRLFYRLTIKSVVINLHELYNRKGFFSRLLNSLIDGSEPNFGLKFKNDEDLKHWRGKLKSYANDIEYIESLRDKVHAHYDREVVMVRSEGTDQDKYDRLIDFGREFINFLYGKVLNSTWKERDIKQDIIGFISKLES